MWVTPDGLQHLLGRAKWDADGVRDDLRNYDVDHFGDAAALLVVNETGDLKKARPSGCSGSTPAPPGGSRTLGPRCSWPTPHRAGTP